MNRPFDIVDVPGWPIAKGYINGALAHGPILFIAGQIGWTPAGVFEREDLPGQFGQALDNVLAVVRAAGGGPENVARMTIYVTSVAAYRASLKECGRAWRERFGKHFPAMALVGVTELVEPKALVEIEATAAFPAVEPPLQSLDKPL